MSTQTVTQLRDMAGTIDQMSAALREIGAAMDQANRRASWDLRIAFADTAKERRRITRDRDRTYRRPALIHKGRKPRG